MKNIKKHKILLYFERNIIFVLLLSIIIFLEVNIYNHRYFVTTFQNLREYQYGVNEGTLFGFTSINGQLKSDNNDPNITFRHIDDRVRYINIQCSNPNLDALSQVFYRKDGEDWAQGNSINFPLYNNEITVSLPRTIRITSLRLDLTNIEGDILFCQGFTINPKTGFNFSFVRLIILIIGIFGLILGNKIIPQKISNSVWNLLINNSMWLFAVLITIIALSYPVTLTFDSAHYLQHAYIIRDGNWASWDPIRNVGFPLQIFLSLSIFGENQNALLYPMIMAHVLLYIFSCLIIFEVFELKSEIHRLITTFVVFIFVAMDPTVLGYFHTLLTEFHAATFAVISCYVAIKLYKSKLFSKQFFMFSSFYLILVPIAWHLKQPYIGASYFPLLIVTLMILIREKSLKTTAYVFGMSLTVLGIVLVSTLSWSSFLRAGDNPMRHERQISTALESQLNYQSAISRANPTGYLKDKVAGYLAFTNYYIFDFHTYSVIKSPMIGRGSENSVIAHRMFTHLGGSNLFFYWPTLMKYAIHFQINYDAPVLINDLFLNRIRASNILFTLTNIFLPVVVLLSGYYWIKTRNTLNASIFILSCASLINLIAHLFLLAPNDRYQFWGYVLNLLIVIIVILALFVWITQKLSEHSQYGGSVRQNHSNSN